VTAVVTLTPEAVKQVKFLMQKQNKLDAGLRVGVKGGGCSGLSYTMTLDTNVTERDQVYEVDGIRVIVDRKSAKFPGGHGAGLHRQELLEGGWKWTNPNAQRSCGCGTSFTPR